LDLRNRREKGREHADGDFSPNGRFGGTERRGKRHSIAGPIVIVCAVVAVLVAADYLMNSGKI
jgi:hypothetical protein